MTQLRWLQSPTHLSSKLLMVNVLVFSLIFTSSVLAEYVPPPESSQPTGSVGAGGTRGGCGEDAATSLTALAPVSHSGQTAAVHPVFAWYVPDTASHTMEFTLYKPEARGGYSILYRMQQNTKAGIMKFTLPKDALALSPQQTYLWEVALLCDPSDPSKDKLAKATIKVVALPSSLKTALAQTSDHLKRSALYAQAGFWYDALAESLEEASAQSFWLGLVENLSRLEMPSSVVGAHKQGEKLQNILTFERHVH